jgi:hypothetical protein
MYSTQTSLSKARPQLQELFSANHEYQTTQTTPIFMSGHFSSATPASAAPMLHAQM